MDLSFYLKYYLLYLENKFMGYPFIIRLTVLIVMGLLLIYVFSLIRFVWINSRIRRRDRIKAKLTKQLNGRVEELFRSEQNLQTSDIEQNFADVLPKLMKADKALLSEWLIEISDSVKEGSKAWNEENYKGLIYLLEIPEFWESELLSNNSTRRHEALRKLDDLGKGFTSSILMRSTNHKNKELRKQARAAVMKYDNLDPYKFLDEGFDTDFNPLDEVLIHHFLMEKAAESELPNLSRWVKNAKNESFKAFMIKEIGNFKQKECIPYLSSLFQEEQSRKLKTVLIDTLGKLDYTDMEDRLIQMYSTSTTDVQHVIISTIARFKSASGLDFLTTQFFKSNDVEQKVHLAYSIKQFGEEGRKRLDNLSEKSNDFERKIFDQVKYQLS